MTGVRKLIDVTWPLPLPAAEFRDAQRAAVEAARTDPERFATAANPDGSSYRYDSHAVQLRLAGAAVLPPAPPVPDVVPFTGRVIPVSKAELGGRPPEMNEFHALALARSARIGVMTPGGGKDAAWLAMEREAAERREQAARDAVRIAADPILRTVANPLRDDDDGW